MNQNLKNQEHISVVEYTNVDRRSFEEISLKISKFIQLCRDVARGSFVNIEIINFKFIFNQNHIKPNSKTFHRHQHKIIKGS